MPTKVNKSEAIRRTLTRQPNAKASEIVKLLADKKIQVKPGLVYMIKGRMAQIRSDKKHKAARVNRTGQKTGISDPVVLIRKIKVLAQDAGGMAQLKGLVAVLAELVVNPRPSRVNR